MDGVQDRDWCAWKGNLGLSVKGIQDPLGSSKDQLSWRKVQEGTPGKRPSLGKMQGLS